MYRLGYFPKPGTILFSPSLDLIYGLKKAKTQEGFRQGVDMVKMPDKLMVDVIINPVVNPIVKAKTADGWKIVAEWVPTEDGGITIVPRDDYHTMSELYEYRMLYNALLFNEWAKHETYPVVKSWHHSDGNLCFGGGWFVVVATLPTGQVSNHYKERYWELFQIPAVVLPPDYDGHTPEEAAKRLFSALTT